MNRWHSPPAELYALVEQTPATVLLETARPSGTASRAANLSRLFTGPLRVLTAHEPGDLANIFAEIEGAVRAGFYAAGFFAYECGHFFEPTAPPRPRRSSQARRQPLAWFGIYGECHLFDHLAGRFLNGDPPGLERSDFSQFQAAGTSAKQTSELQLEASIDFTEQAYIERVSAIHEWIRSGDVYQLNFTVPMHVHAEGTVAAHYQRLRSRQPVPYGAFLHCQPSHRILSFSPELFFRVEQQVKSGGVPTRLITTQPMKGTAPRGRTTGEDCELAEWLSHDAKNRSENVMIVDLLRNDLGRLCNYGSVRAEKLFAVERYPTLLQMTSTVTGELRSDVGFQEIFRALFPCGSITGAPKVRAMQLIAEIENEPRGVYTGAIGFFSRELSIFNVAIRTLELDGESGRMGVGSGVVIDSDPASEFSECLLKAKFLTDSLHRGSGGPQDAFSLIESLLWNNGYPLIDLHLDRLEDSARYFGYPCDRAATKTALLAHAEEFAVAKPRKVRLLLNRDGDLEIESELLPESTKNAGAPSIPHLVAEWVGSHALTMNAEAKPIRVRISTDRTNPDDPMFFHKTTNRFLYNEALKAAVAAGFDDVLFLNDRGEVTECAIHNVFIEKDGLLITPPIECGVLPGVHRRHLLETRPSTIERTLSLDDLRHADTVYLSNAVRGLRRGTIDWEG
jgi:para-aminobenzoate synthetase/4-amino-4-deoxychorismate lyase